MAIHRLYIDEFESTNYFLIAIHTNLEDFRLGYFINKSLDLELKKNPTDIPIESKEGKTNFARFEFNDENKAINWNLIENKSQIITQNKNSTIDLFADVKIQTLKKVYLLPEFKKVDFFLKVNYDDEIKISELINKLNKIEQISTIYQIDINNIKNKNNLIF
ncbi:MAG: IPExxxVDY family protein [Flavobacterium sp.]|nr:IPExxxVDY family protein [Flavobacterium sp.]